MPASVGRPRLRRVRHAVRRERAGCPTRACPSGHRSSSTHSGQRGAREMQTARPCQISRCDHSTQAERGTICHELALDALRVGLGREAQAPREAADVRVDRDALAPPERVAADDGGGLAAHARQAHQLLRAARHLAAVALEHGQRGRAAQGARLLVVEAGLEDRLGDLALVGVGERLRVGIALEQPGGDHVDALVGALRREDGGHEQLPWRPEVERAARLRILGAQAAQDRPHAALGRGRGAQAGHAAPRCQPGAGQSRSSAGQVAQCAPERAMKLEERSLPIAARTSAASQSTSVCA